MNEKRTRQIVALVLDAAIVIAVALSTYVLFEYMGKGVNNKFAEFSKYFTVQSNLVLGLVAFVALLMDLLLVLGKIKTSPLWTRILLFAASVGTTITMLTVIFFLGPTMGYGSMYNDANLFMHLLTPLLAIARVIFFEKETLHFSATFIGAIHMTVYGIFYLSNVIMNNGYGTVQYDWYGFGAGGLGLGILALFIMVLVAYGIAFLTYFGQKKLAKSWSKES